MIFLLEDLYLHTCTNWKEPLPELCACHCVINSEPTQHIDFFEPIDAKSVNEAVSKARQFYFPNQGTPGASVYITVKKSGDNQTLEKVREGLLDKFKKS